MLGSCVPSAHVAGVRVSFHSGSLCPRVNGSPSHWRGLGPYLIVGLTQCLCWDMQRSCRMLEVIDRQHKRTEGATCPPTLAFRRSLANMSLSSGSGASPSPSHSSRHRPVAGQQGGAKPAGTVR